MMRLSMLCLFYMYVDQYKSYSYMSDHWACKNIPDLYGKKECPLSWQLNGP